MNRLRDNIRRIRLAWLLLLALTPYPFAAVTHNHRYCSDTYAMGILQETESHCPVCAQHISVDEPLEGFKSDPVYTLVVPLLIGEQPNTSAEAAPTAICLRAPPFILFAAY